MGLFLSYVFGVTLSFVICKCFVKYFTLHPVFLLLLLSVIYVYLTRLRHFLTETIAINNLAIADILHCLEKHFLSLPLTSYDLLILTMTSRPRCQANSCKKTFSISHRHSNPSSRSVFASADNISPTSPVLALFPICPSRNTLPPKISKQPAIKI